MWHAASLRHNLLTRHLAIKGHLLHKLVRVGHGLDISCRTHEAVALQKLFNQPAQKTKHKQRTEQTMAQAKEDNTNSWSNKFKQRKTTKTLDPQCFVSSKALQTLGILFFQMLNFKDVQHGSPLRTLSLVLAPSSGVTPVNNSSSKTVTEKVKVWWMEPRNGLTQKPKTLANKNLKTYKLTSIVAPVSCESLRTRPLPDQLLHLPWSALGSLLHWGPKAASWSPSQTTGIGSPTSTQQHQLRCWLGSRQSSPSIGNKQQTEW